ncbi:MAG: hypothetical protein MUF49_27910 [Oculatellaceae cyanobacterium Prado106]|jgi:hypothetical protein|nr:hypothetical protein [Oculatellaceae cyanobacterium Prado106]
MNDSPRETLRKRPLITLTLQSLDLSAEELQADAEALLPQLREIEGVEDLGLVALAEAPPNTKSMGGFVLGALKFTIENSNILKGLLGVGNAIVGNGKGVKLTVKAASGQEYSAEAKDLAELEQIIQMAEASLGRLE